MLFCVARSALLTLFRSSMTTPLFTVPFHANDVQQLFRAIIAGDDAVIKRLANLFGKPLLNFTGVDAGETPLLSAMGEYKGDSGKNWRLLLALGADPTLVAGNTSPIIRAIEICDLEFIKAAAVDPFAPFQGRFLLPCEKHCKNANELAQTLRTLRPIDVMFRAGWTQGALVAIAHADPNFTLTPDPNIPNEQSALQHAVFYGMDAVVEKLIRCNAKPDANLLQTLSRGINHHFQKPNEVNGVGGRTNAGPRKLPTEFINVCNYILDAGVDPRTKDAFGRDGVDVVNMFREDRLTESIARNLVLRATASQLTRAVHDQESKFGCLSDEIMDKILEAYHPRYKRACNMD